MICKQTKEGRHQTNADIGACHLDSYHGLRTFCSKIFRCRVDNTGIYRRTPQTNQGKSNQGRKISQGQQHYQNSHQYNPLAHTDHLFILPFHGYKTVDSTSDGNPDTKHSGKGSSCFGVDSFCKIQIAACPKHRCLLDSAIAEETKYDCLCPRNRYNFLEGERFSTLCFLSCRILFLPLGETDDQNCCKYHLQQRHNPISHIPRGSAGKHRSQSIGNRP